jgi:hypothetical protein
MKLQKRVINLLSNNLEKRLHIGEINIGSEYNNIFKYRLPADVIQHTRLKLNQTSNYNLLVNSEYMKLLELEAITYLFLSTSYNIPIVSKPLKILLNTFMLSSKEYLHFCLTYLGEYVHMKPLTTDMSEKDRLGVYNKLSHKLDDINTTQSEYVICYDFIQRWKNCQVPTKIPNVEIHKVMAALLTEEISVLSSVFDKGVYNV